MKDNINVQKTLDVRVLDAATTAGYVDVSRQNNRIGRTRSQDNREKFTPGERAKQRAKTVPADWKTLPEKRFRQVITHIEAVLLDISTDGRVDTNPFDRTQIIPTLNRWAEHLRMALRELTK
jgi:hypothetical protein